jgi:hypothetical protein
MSTYNNPCNAFLFLDIRAKKLGDIKNLTSAERLDYIQLGYGTGFLSKKDCEELPKELSLKIDFNSLTVQDE